MSQTNVKEILYVCDMGLKKNVTLNFKEIRNDFPKEIKDIISELKNIDLNDIFNDRDSLVICNSKLEKKHFNFETILPENLFATETKSGFVYLDITQSDDLLSEGFAREISRRVQSARKDMGLTRVDKINLYIDVSDDIKDFIQSEIDLYKEKIGANKIEFIDFQTQNKKSEKFKIKDKEIEFSIEVI